MLLASEKLQLTKDLTLKKASEMARNSELVKSQIRDLQSKNLDAVRVKRHTQDPPHQVNRGRGAQRVDSLVAAEDLIIRTDRM